MLSKPSWSYQPVCSWKHFFTEPITMVMCLSLTMSRSQLTLLTGAETSPHGVNVTGPTCIRGCSQMTSTLSAGFTSDQPCIEGTLYTLNTWVVWSEYCWYVAGENDDIIYEQALILNVSKRREATTPFTEQVFRLYLIALEYHRSKLYSWELDVKMAMALLRCLFSARELKRANQLSSHSFHPKCRVPQIWRKSFCREKSLSSYEICFWRASLLITWLLD